jgi:hypothetical protein
MSTATLKKTKINVSEIKTGDVFSEESHYIYEGWNGKTRQFKHLESGQTINLDDKYVEDLLTTADQYDKEQEVGREDKLWTAKQLKDANNTVNREGDVRVKGIRSIWSGIHTSKVFTVCFTKQGKELSDTQLQKAKDAKLQQVLDAIDKAQKAKKGVVNAAKDAITDLLNSPIATYVPGDERVLRGYKVQFESITGNYDVIDMDINERRQVNVNTIKWLVVDGVKYIVK